MKSLWNATSFVAVVNLLALAMFVGWLWQSDRLSRERVEAVRTLFTVTIPAEEQAAREREREAAEALELLQAEEQRANPPAASVDQLLRISRIKEQELQVTRRLEEERNAILAQVERRAAELEAERAEFEARKQAWADAIAEEQERKDDEQFAKTVKLLQGLPAKQAKQQLITMVDSGQVDRAVAYLDAMEMRVAGRILSEFKSDAENALAADLLERLRTFGLDASPSEESAHDRQPSGTSAPDQASAAAG